MRICSMGPGDYDKEMLWQGNPLALEWWNQWGASSALGYGPPGHTLVGRGVVPSGQPLVLWVNLKDGKYNQSLTTQTLQVRDISIKGEFCNIVMRLFGKVLSFGKGHSIWGKKVVWAPSTSSMTTHNVMSPWVGIPWQPPRIPGLTVSV